MGLKTQDFIKIETPAKVTLRLEVPERLPDGYHRVRIALAPISLYDTLQFRVTPGDGVSLEVDEGLPPFRDSQRLGPDSENLAVRAAQVLLAELGRNYRIDLKMFKRIPVGAGLGGGSGNAAGVLVALNRWMGTPLSLDTLERLAATLGMDVPFFVEPRPAWAEGRGERLRPLQMMSGLELLVIQPAFAISTAEAYGHVVPEGRDLVVPEGGEADQDPPHDPSMDTVDNLSAALRNRFEDALFPRHPELVTLRDGLLEAGAAGALLSGSGSAVFGVFRDAAARDAAAHHLLPRAAENQWRLYPCTTLAHHRYDLIH